MTIALMVLGVTSAKAQGGYAPTGNNIYDNRTEWYKASSPTNTAGNRTVFGWLNTENSSWEMRFDTIRFTKIGGGENKMVMANANGKLYTQFFDYQLLMNKPAIPDAQIQSDWNATSGVMFIQNKPTLFNGDYNSLINKPTIFNGDYNSLINKPTIPTNTNQLTNGSGFITGVTSTMINNALGYTPISNLSTFTTSNLTEGTNLYFTNARARSAISGSGSISYNSSTGVISSTAKTSVPYSGTTNSSGIYTITYPVAYTVAPNVQFQVVGGTNKTTILMTSSTTTGCSFKVESRADVIGLLPTYSNVNGASIDVLVTEK